MAFEGSERKSAIAAESDPQGPAGRARIFEPRPPQSVYRRDTVNGKPPCGWIVIRCTTSGGVLRA